MANTQTNLTIVWNGSLEGNGSITVDEMETKIAIPESFGGSGKGAEPKGLLVSSAATCYTMTLVAMLETRKFAVTHFVMDTQATLTKEGKFTIIHSPQITLSADATEEQIQSAHRALAAADKGCMVGNLLKKADVQIEIDGKVSVLSAENI